MATHFICQSTEPLPHVYPTGLPQKSHGAVSQYEVYNNANKVHTQFPPPGWDFSQTSEEDSLPLLQPAPQPEWRNSSLHPDPELCITPQKTNTNVKTFNGQNGMVCHEKTKFDPDPMLTLTPEKSFVDINKAYDKNNYIVDKGKKVRFDVENNDKQMENIENETVDLKDKIETCDKKVKSFDKVYKPEMYGENEGKSDLDETYLNKSRKSRTVKYTLSEVGDQPVYVEYSGNEDTCTDQEQVPQTHKTVRPKPSVAHSKADPPSLPVKIVREKPSNNTPTDPIANCQIPEESGPKRKVKVLRENQYLPKTTEYTFPFGQICTDYAGEEHMFQRPEYNSTLRMKLAADQLKQCEVDVEVALKKKLSVSDNVTSDINEKASSHVNKQGSTYSGLVSLDIPAGEICQQALEMKTVRAKSTTAGKQKRKDHREPDLLEFFTSDRQKESVTYSLPGISAPSEKLSKAPQWRAFDLYKHNRVWEGRASVRVIENWEMMRLAESLKDDPKCTQLANELVHKDRVLQLFREYSESCKGKTEAMYQVMLLWKEKCNGLALIGDLAKLLRKHGFRDLAESYPP